MGTARIEALRWRHPGLSQLRGAVLAHDVDPELQVLSTETAKELATPMAAVSLVLERVQFLRGYHGLPPDLEASRATDRDMSFCQFVVRDGGIFEVNDAQNDLRVPHEMVDRYGVASYLGAPLRLGGAVVGAMCVADTKPRLFTVRERAVLLRAAEAASTRLATLAMRPRDLERTLHDRTVRPAFGEMRNRLQPMLGNLTMMQIALTELAAVHRLQHHAATTGDTASLALITRADEMLADLQGYIDEMSRDAGGIHRAVVALERASLVSATSCSVKEVLEAATTLALHRTKLIGEVWVTGDQSARLTAPRSVAVSAVATALSALADALFSAKAAGGISLHALQVESCIVIEMGAALNASVLEQIATQLRVFLGESSPARIDAHSGLLVVELEARTAIASDLPVAHF